ncbi:MAG TPA: TolC family protein [Polyangia bacterium]|jgi:outer membrane protein TolC
MIGRPRVARHLTCLLLLTAVSVGAAPSAWARKFSLPQLLEMARGNPGLQASAAATEASQAQVTEAKMNWLPQGDLLSILAPSPNLHCVNPFVGTPGTTATEPCVETTSPEARITDVTWNRIFTRTEVKLIQPVYDFGKISAGIAAAEAGVGVSRQKEAGARADIELNVRKAYYGLKFAREVIDMLDEGSGYVDDALKKLDKDLANGTGNVSVTDRLRMRTVRAELDARILEAKRLQGIARESLRTLLGSEAPADIDVDDEEFEPPEVKERMVTYYEDLARANRPEVRMLEYAVKAKSALADLERRKEYPDFVLIATGVFAYAQTADDPQNAFYNHYFNSRSAGLAAALRMQLDLGPKIARARKTEAEALEITHRRSEALGGILLEVRKSYTEANEAASRVTAMDKGQKAGKAWISAVAQNFAVGLAEARDLSDALVAFFGMRTRYLQAVFDLHMARSALSRATGSAEL